MRRTRQIIMAAIALAGVTRCIGSEGNGSLTRGLLLPCPNPVPLSKLAGPVAQGFIVQFHAGVDAAAETQRLADLYGFTPITIYQATPGFFAVLDSRRVDEVRCEASVQGVFYNQVLYPN